MKTTCAILMLVTLTMTVTSKDNDKKPFDINGAVEEMNYYVHGMQGFWQGYMQGLYNTNKPTHITPLCLSPEISEKYANLAR